MVVDLEEEQCMCGLCGSRGTSWGPTNGKITRRMATLVGVFAPVR
jgi:hypothetical protein